MQALKKYFENSMSISIAIAILTVPEGRSQDTAAAFSLIPFFCASSRLYHAPTLTRMMDASMAASAIQPTACCP